MAGYSNNRWASQIGRQFSQPFSLPSHSWAGGRPPFSSGDGVEILQFPSEAGEITGPFILQNLCLGCIQEALAMVTRVPRVSLHLPEAWIPHGPKLGSGHYVPNSSPMPPTSSNRTQTPIPILLLLSHLVTPFPTHINGSLALCPLVSLG